jgi:hypothetical protein
VNDRATHRDIEVDEITLTLHCPLDELPHPARAAITRWLTEHGIDPGVVALHTPIERDAVHGGVAWREHRPDGLVVRHRFPALPDVGTWPASFPVLTEVAQDPVPALPALSA